MHPETEISQEQSPVQLLIEIQNSNKFLFHGSPNELSSINPSKPKGDLSEKEFNKTESVFATSSAARAVLSAIMPKMGKGTIEWGTHQDGKGHTFLRCNEQVLTQVRPGFVYVLGEKEHALKDEEFGSTQYKYNHSVIPLIAIPVSLEDFQNLGGKIETT